MFKGLSDKTEEMHNADEAGFPLTNTALTILRWNGTRLSGAEVGENISSS